MKQISMKLWSIFAIILFIAVIPIAVLATNEGVSVVVQNNEELKQEYIIYIKDYIGKQFKYAFTNNSNPEESDLSYIISISDFGDNQVAYLDAETYEIILDKNQPIYMWAKDENENLILKGIQLDLSKALTEEEIDNTETLTTRIEVEIADSEEDTTTIRNENVDGVEETVSVGYVKIKDDEKAAYYYERIKLSNSEEYNQLMTLAEKIKDEYEGMDMYEKIQIGAEFNALYSKVMNEAKWQEVEDMIIEQPEESKENDKYIVLLKKVDKDGNVTTDIQFLTAFEAYKPNVVKEEVVTQETTKLPITYDSIALFVALGVIGILVIAIVIRIKKLKKQD